MATVDVPLYWSGTTPRFTSRQRSLSVASGLSGGAASRAAITRRHKLSILYDFRRSYSLRRRELGSFKYQVIIICEVLLQALQLGSQ